jgi:hypothetical protein
MYRIRQRKESKSYSYSISQQGSDNMKKKNFLRQFWYADSKSGYKTFHRVSKLYGILGQKGRGRLLHFHVFFLVS